MGTTNSKKDKLLVALLSEASLSKKLWLLMDNSTSLSPELLEEYLQKLKLLIPSLPENRIQELVDTYLEVNILLQKNNPKQARLYQHRTIDELERLVDLIIMRLPLLGRRIECNILSTKAQIERFAGDLENAESMIQEAVQIAKDINDPVRLTNALHIWAFIVRDQRTKPEKAEMLFKEALATLEKVDNKDDQIRYKASIMNNLATLYFYNGNPAASFKLLDELFKMSAGYEHPLLLDTLAIAYGNSGLFYYEAGDMKSALFVLEKSDELAKRTKNTEQIVRNYINRGIFLNEIGMISESIESLQFALEINEEKTCNLEYTVAIHKILGEVHRAQHNYELALEQYHLAEEKSIDHDNLVIHYAESLHHEGTVYTELEQYDRAKDCYSAALTKYKDMKLTNTAPYFNALIGCLRVRLFTNDLIGLEDELKALIDNVEERGLELYKLMSMNWLAELYYREKEWNQALQLNNKVKEMSEKGNNLLLKDILYRNAKIYYEMCSFPKAIELIEPLVSEYLVCYSEIPSLDYLINNNSVGTIPGLRKTELINTNLQFLELLIDSYLAIGDCNNALKTLSELKETYFSDILSSTDIFSSDILADKEFSDKLKEIRILESSLDSLKISQDSQLSAIRGATAAQYHEDSKSLRSELVSRYSKLKKRISQKNRLIKPKTIKQAYKEAYEEIIKESSSPTDTAIVESYYSERGFLFTFLLTEGDDNLDVKEFKQSIDNSVFNNALKKLREEYDEISARLIRGKTPFGGLNSTSVINQHKEKLDEFSKILVAPLEKEMRSKELHDLIIIPYRDLNTLSFAPLMLQSEGKYLVERYHLTYLPVISLNRLRPKKQQMLKNQVVSFIGIGSGHIVDEYDTFSKKAEEWKYSVKGGVFIGLSLDSFISSIQGTDMLHFSGHGHVDSKKPWLSYLDLGQSKLLVEDALIGRIPHQNWELVFLNGCQTALPGKDDLGLYSMASAFLACGAQSIIATLWRIEDEAAVIFAKQFYMHYFQLRNPGQALALTQRDFIKGNLQDISEKRREELKHPYYWASYICIGLP